MRRVGNGKQGSIINFLSKIEKITSFKINYLFFYGCCIKNLRELIGLTLIKNETNFHLNKANGRITSYQKKV